MDVRRRPRIPDAEWESQRERVQDLYIKQDMRLEGPQGVMQTMATIYGFEASKAQYETRLKKWGFRKYSKKDDWLALSHVLRSRKEEGKKSKVLLDGKVVPPDRVRKEIQRHLKQKNGESGSQVQPLPCHMSIRTPPPLPRLLPSELTNVPQTQLGSSSPQSHSLIPIASDDLFLEPLEYSLPSQRDPSLNFPETGYQSPIFLDQVNVFDALWDPAAGADFFPTMLPDPIQPDPTGGQVSMVFPGYHAYNDETLFHLNSPEFPYIGLSEATVGLSCMNAQDMFSLPDFSTSMHHTFMGILPMVHSFIEKFRHSREDVSSLVISKLRQPNTTLLPRTKSFDLGVLQFIFHRLVNNGDADYDLKSSNSDINSLSQELYDAGLQYLFSLEAGLLSELLDSTPFPYATALQQGLFCAAIKMRAGNPVKEILKQGFDPDRPLISNIYGSPEHPLRVSCRRLHLEVTHILLDSSAGLNKDVINQSLHELLQYSRQRKDLKAGLDIMRLLLSKGATLEPESLAILLPNCESQALSLLVHHFSHSSYKMFIKNYGLAHIMQRNRLDSLVISAVKSILEHNYSDDVKSSNIWKICLSAALSNAIGNESSDVVDLLTDAGAVLNSDCLFHAVHNQDMKMLIQCLELGFDPTVPYGRRSSYQLLDREATALSESIRQEYQEALQIFIERGFVAKLGHNSESFQITLIAACSASNDSLVEDLVLQNESRSMLFDNSEVVVTAIQSCKDSTVIRLLGAGYKVSLEALFRAVEARRSTLADLLMGACDRETLRDDSEYSWHDIVLETIWWGNMDIVRKMIRSGTSLNEYGYFDDERWRPPEMSCHLNIGFGYATPLSAAILKGNYAVIEVLLESGAQLNTEDPNNEDEEAGLFITALTACVATHNFQLLQEILYRGADPFDNNAIFVAASLGYEEALEILLQVFVLRYPKGQKSFGSKALLWAIRARNRSVTQLLAKSADANCLIETDDVDEEGEGITLTPLGATILWGCRSSDDDEWLQILLRYSGNPNSVVKTTVKSGLTALLYAIELGSLDMVVKLVDAGADVSLQPLWGIRRTPLQSAAERGNEKIVDYLLQHGADPTERPSIRGGATALQLAAIKGFVGIATRLLERGADVNAEPALIEGRTAFEGATEYGRIEMMLFLFQKGADLLFNSQRQYQRAISFARKNGQFAAIDFAGKLVEAVGGNKDVCTGDDEERRRRKKDQWRSIIEAVGL